MDNDSLQHLGLLVVGVLIAGLLFLVWKWPQGIHTTFSHHAAAQKSSIVYYFWLFVVTLPLLFMFFAGWFVPYFTLSYWFLIYIGLSQLLQHTVTIIPEIGGWKSTWHQRLTAGSALLLLPALVLILLDSDVSLIARGIVYFSVLLMTGIIGQQLIRTSGKARYLLLFQSGYYGAFFVAIVATTYLG